MSEDVRRTEEDNSRRRSRILGLDYIDTTQINNKTLYNELLTNQELYDMRIIPISADKFHIIFGVTNNTSQATLKALRQKFLDQKVTFALISDSGYREYMKLYDPDEKVVYHDIELAKVESSESVETVSFTLDQVKADDMLAYLVQQAHKLNASDIHVETQQDDVRVRFRIDGVLHPVAKMSHDKYRVLMSAIASAGNISTNSDEAQQGHIYEKVTMADGTLVDINIRLETTPTINGMDAVMRLFNMDTSMFSLDKLGLSAPERAVVDDIIAKPSGLVLMVGPTGSGKTTTLYSIINTLSNNERKVITIEDPVEYQFPGITQISIAGKSGEAIHESFFAEKFRAVLRLDPDIVLVGEIRDVDTARTALQASLTGHLVLSTFHAGSAAATLTRLMDMIGSNPLFLSSIRLIMAQRLVRRLDDKNKEAYAPDAKTADQIKKILNTLPSKVPKPDLSNLKLYKPVATKDNPFGYSGRIAIREQFIMTDKILDLLQTSKVSSTNEIEEAAIEGGMVTMAQDAMLKVITGQTTLDEVYRVIDAE